LNLDVIAEGGLSKGEIKTREESLAAAFKLIQFGDMENHVKIARAPAAAPIVALTGEMHSGPGLYAGRNREIDLFVLLDNPIAVANVATILDDHTCSLAVWARGLSAHLAQESVSDRTDHSLPLAGRTGVRRLSTFYSGAVAPITLAEPVNFNVLLDTVDNVNQRELEVITHI
jgi:hypothetical protein